MSTASRRDQRGISSAVAVGFAVAFVAPLLVVGLGPSSLGRLSASSFLLLHNTIELFSVTVSLSIFGVEWHSFRQGGNRRGLFLGAAFLGIGLLDALHAFSIPGMPDLFTPNSAEKSLVFRAAARMLTASALLASPFVDPRASSPLLGKRVLRLMVLLIVGGLELAVLFHPGRLLEMYVGPKGDAPPWTLWEYPVIGLFIVALFAAWRQRGAMVDFSPVLPIPALLGCTLSEVAMTLVRTNDDDFAVLGHLYKAVSFYLIYRSVFSQAVGEPYQRLSHSSERLLVEVTEHERAEAELREAKSFNERIVLESPVGISVHRADGRCILANEALARMMGATREKLEAQNFLETDSWRSSGMVDAARATLATGTPWRLSAPFTSTSTRTLWVDTQMLRVVLNREPHLLVLTLDMTEAHGTGEAIRQARDRLRLATDVADIGVWTQGFVDGRVIWDERMFDIFGVPPNERTQNVSHDTWRTRCHPDDLERVDRDLRRGLRSDKPFGSEYRIVLPSGVRHIQAAAFVERDVDGRARQVVGISRDITLQRELEKSLRESKLAADAANQAKGEFLANMSHEIRTPLNAVLGLTHLVLDSELSPTQRRYLERVQMSSKTLLGILNDILDYSKIEAGRLELEEVDFELDEILFNTIELFSPLAEEKGLELVFEVAFDVPLTVRGDPLRVGQVLNNLVGNAVKFTEQGEVHVTVDTAGRDLGLEFTIRDTGIGMTKAQVDRVFQAFNQADTSTTRKFGGTGLGLTISRRLVQLMKGAIDVKSALGAGSTFKVALPLRVVTAPSGIRRASELSGRRTLVVDDHQTTRRALEKMLLAWSFEVTLVSSGAEGLLAMGEALRAGRPFELVLVNWKMPAMDGLDFARAARALDGAAAQASLVLMVPTFERESLAIAASAAGITAALEKPVTRSRLVELLSGLETGTLAHLQGEPVAAAGGLLERASAIRGARVLVAEDNSTNQLVARGLLEMMGLVADVVSDGQAAIDHVAREDYDAVLMDLQMPGVDGLEATRKIRAMERGRRLPIIAMTAGATKRDREVAEAAGMNGHVGKPVDAEDLLSAMLAWLPHRPQGTTAPRAARASSVGAPAPEPGLDFDPVSTLQRLGGDRKLLGRILASFEGDAPQLCRDLRHEIETGDWKRARALAHKLKGVAGDAGASSLARQVSELEWELKHRRSRGLLALEEKARRAVQHCRRFLEHANGALADAPKVSRDDARTALAELRVLLERHRIVPIELLEQVEGARAWGPSPESMDALVGAVESFKYPEALAALGQVRTQMEVTDDEPSSAPAPASPGGG